MAVRSFYNEIKGLKLRDLPAHLRPKMSLDYVKKAIDPAADRYYDKYINTSSADPLFHVCYGVMVFSYFVNFLPFEGRHLKQQQQHGSGH